MSPQISDSKFVSLKLQVAGAFALVASLIVLVFAVVTYIWTAERLERHLDEEQSKYETNFEQLISMNGDALVDVADHVVLLAGFKAASSTSVEASKAYDSLTSEAPGLTSIMRAIDVQWDNLNMFGDIDGIVLMGDRAEVLAQKGQINMAPVIELLQWVPKKGKSESLIFCSDDCRLYMTVPILLKGGQRYVMVIVESISDVINAMSNSFQVDLALAISSKESTYLGRLANWNLGLLSSSSQALTKSVLPQASRDFTLKQLMSGGQKFKVDGAAWALWAIEINDRGDVLLVSADLTEEQTSSQALMRMSLLFALLAGLVSVLVGMALLWRPVKRIALHRKMLPLLADGQYEEVREQLAPDYGAHYNEVDLLDMATIDLSRRLEFLSREVELRTGELERMAMFDSLTHLPNRSLFVHELREALSELKENAEESVGLLFLDLDAFKRVNETLGHMAGDHLLVQMSRRLQKICAEQDTLCRLGGDEFAIICRHLKDPDDIHVFLRKVLAELRTPMDINGRILTVTASIGVVCSNNPDASPEDLTRQADLAMFAAKDEGRNSFHFFNDQMLVDVSKALELESELQDAIDKEQFCLFLQPKFNLKTGDLDSFEALVRWRHPEKGLIMPNHFIPQMEQGELIFQLGRWVISHGLDIIRGLENTGLGKFKLAVNLSARQFCDDKLVDHLKECLNGMPGERLELEITENVLLHNSDLAASIMKKANALGVTVALDDFGTGYSSLSYLRELPVDVIKLDRSFITPTTESEESRHIVTSVIDLAHKLNKTLVAEGIETKEHLIFLQQYECDSAQGFLLARPIDELELPDVLAKGEIQEIARQHLNEEIVQMVSTDDVI